MYIRLPAIANLQSYIYTYTHIYVHVCVCVCAHESTFNPFEVWTFEDKNTEDQFKFDP